MLLEKEVGLGGKFILEKQCKSLNIDPDKLSPSDLEPLSVKISWAIKSFTGEKRAEDIKKSILDYRKALNIVGGTVTGQTPESIIEAELTIAENKLSVGMHAEAKESLAKARAVQEKLSGMNAEAFDSRISRMMAKALSGSANTLEQAAAEYRRAIESGKASDQHFEVAMSWNGIGAIEWRLGRHKQSLKFYNKALEALSATRTESRNDKLKKQNTEAVIKTGLGNVYLDLLEFDKAITANEEAIEVFRATDNKPEMGRVYNNLARVYEEMGDYPRAIDRYERGIRLSQESGSHRMHGWALTNLASALTECGRADEARPHLEKAERILAEFNDPIAQSKLNCMWGKYHREKAEWSSAIERFESSISALKDIKSPDYLATAQDEFGLMYAKKGDAAKAKPLLEKAIAWYVEKKDTARAAKLKKALSGLKL